MVRESRPTFKCIPLHLHTGAIRSYCLDGFALLDGLSFVSHVIHMNVSCYAYIQALSELIILTASRCLMGKEIRNELFAEVSGSNYIFFSPFSLYYLDGFALFDGQENP